MSEQDDRITQGAEDAIYVLTELAKRARAKIDVVEEPTLIEMRACEDLARLNPPRKRKFLTPEDYVPRETTQVRDKKGA